MRRESGSGSGSSADSGGFRDHLHPPPGSRVQFRLQVAGRGFDRFEGPRDGPDDGNLAGGAPGEMAPKRRLQAGDRHLVGAKSPGERVPAAGLDRLRGTQQNAGLGASEQLVSGEDHEIRPRRHPVGEGGLVLRTLHSELRQRLQVAASEVLDDRNPELRSQRHEVGSGRRLGEADDPEVGLVDLEQRSDLAATLGYGPAVVVSARAVRRSHFDEPRAALLQDVRDAEGIPDFDQFPARHDDVFPGGEGVERQQDAAGGVSGDHRRLPRKHGLEQPGEVLLTTSPGTGSEIEFEVGIADRNAEHGLGGALGKRRSSEVGVDDDSGGVDHPPEVGPGGSLEPRLHRGGQPDFRIAGKAPGNGRRAHRPAKFGNLRPQRGGNQRPPEGGGEGPEALFLEEAPHRGKSREGTGLAFGHGIAAEAEEGLRRPPRIPTGLLAVRG